MCTRISIKNSEWLNKIILRSIHVIKLSMRTANVNFIVICTSLQYVITCITQKQLQGRQMAEEV
jgi:hypothetical protein